MRDRRRILVVEDDESLRETIGEILVDEGHDVRLAADGRLGLDSMDGWTPDLIILDIMMPRMDAFAFRAEQLQGGPHRPAVLVLSATSDIATAARDLNADAFVSKPFILQSLLGEVHRLLTEVDPGPA